MKLFKKKLMKKTVEAYACSSCGDPSDCPMNCVDIDRFQISATFYAYGTVLQLA